MSDRRRFLQLAEERLSEAATLYKHAMTCLDSPAQEPDDHVTSLLDRARTVVLIAAGYATLALALAIAPEERR